MDASGGGGQAGVGATDAGADAQLDVAIDALNCPDGSVPVGGSCRQECTTSADCPGIWVCVEGACFSPPQACGACKGGVCATTQLCRKATDACDMEERCDGTSTTCPADQVEPATTVCRPGSPTDLCDRDEACDGSSKACPADVPLTCPAATVCAADEKCVLPNGHRIAFATSVGWQLGASGGLAGADALCQTRANAVRFDGQFIALLSTSVVDARDRIVDQAYYRVDDVLIATSKADLFDGTIANHISVYETGGIKTSLGAATGSNPDGTAHVNTCQDWTDATSGSQFRFGSSGQTSGFWISIGQVACGPILSGVYCFQD